MPIETKLCRNVQEVFYTKPSFHYDHAKDDRCWTILVSAWLKF